MSEGLKCVVCRDFAQQETEMTCGAPHCVSKYRERTRNEMVERGQHFIQTHRWLSRGMPVRDEIRELARRGNVTWEERSEVFDRGNSDEHDLMTLALDDAGLAKMLAYYGANAFAPVKPVSYNDALCGFLLVEVIRRLELREPHPAFHEVLADMQEMVAEVGARGGLEAHLVTERMTWWMKGLRLSLAEFQAAKGFGDQLSALEHRMVKLQAQELELVREKLSRLQAVARIALKGVELHFNEHPGAVTFIPLAKELAGTDEITESLRQARSACPAVVLNAPGGGTPNRTEPVTTGIGGGGLGAAWVTSPAVAVVAEVSAASHGQHRGIAAVVFNAQKAEIERLTVELQKEQRRCEFLASQQAEAPGAAELERLKEAARIGELSWRGAAGGGDVGLAREALWACAMNFARAEERAKALRGDVCPHGVRLAVIAECPECAP